MSVTLYKETPTKLRINCDSSSLKELKNLLSYKDKQVEMQISNLKKNYFFKQRYGEEWVEDRINEFKKELYKSILFEDEMGYWTLPGIAFTLKKSLNGVGIDCEILYDKDFVFYPEFKLIPWNKVPEYELREYQAKSVESLLKAKHGHISIATGGGKSSIILELAKRTGLKSLIIAPSESIAKQLYDDFITYLGKKYVGFYGSGKKQSDKLFTIGIAQSITRIEPGTEDWNNLANIDVFIFDETHLIAADTFFKIDSGIASKAPYRFYTTATPERNDGKDIVLKGIIGNCVYEKTIKDLQEEGFLAKISTLVFEVESLNQYTGSNAIKNNQHHLYRNKEILNIIAKMVPEAIKNNMPTLILIDEHEQEELLRNKLGNIYEYAKGGSDTKKIVEDFNSGKIMCVVGTSAVSTGTNFKPVKLTINWQGNMASTKVKQGPIGRSTRIDERTGKKECKIIDFMVLNNPMCLRHSKERCKLYLDVGPVFIARKDGTRVQLS